ncbi:PMD domain-containing protein, partial [Cephalotus follicularis]
CSQTHTFIVAWGYFTITFEDVMAWYHLPCLIIVAGKLHSWIILEGKTRPSTPPKRLSFSNWFHYFFKMVDKSNKSFKGEGFKTKLELTIFLAMWLSKYIFPGKLQDGVSQRVFPLAFKLEKGISFGLAYAFFNRLYKRLDQYREAME